MKKILSKATLLGILSLLCILVTLISLVGCITKPKHGSLSGAIALINDSGDPSLDPMDFSGVEVSLYKVVEPDSTLRRIHNQYPGIGIRINQETEFCHQERSPVLTVRANADGSYKLEKVPFGTYNLVCSKDGWGTVYRYEVQIDKANRDFIHEKITLYPMVILPHVINEALVFKTDHRYRVSRDIVILGECTFQGGAWVELDRAANISFMGGVIPNQSENWIHFISSTTGCALDEEDWWNTIKFYGEGLNLQGIHCKGANSGISLYNDDCVLENIYVQDSNNGISAGVTRATIKNTLFRDITSRGVVYNQAENSDIINHILEKNVFYRCFIGLRTQGQAVQIKNNYFVNNTTALSSFSYFHIIENNNFDQNKKAITLSGTRIRIQLNNFYDNEIGFSFPMDYYIDIPQPIINNNNFFQTAGYVIDVRPLMLHMQDIDATQNYWKKEDIPSLIYDSSDYQYINQSVIYLPKRNSVVANAGINV